MGPIGMPELILIFVVALIVFGPRKLPELGKSLGKGLAEFRRASNELRSTIEEEVRAIETELPSNSSINSSHDTNSSHDASSISREEKRALDVESPAGPLTTESKPKIVTNSDSQPNVDAH